MELNAYFMDLNLGMTDYEFVGCYNIAVDEAFLKILRHDRKKGLLWKFVLSDGSELTF